MIRTHHILCRAKAHFDVIIRARVLVESITSGRVKILECAEIIEYDAGVLLVVLDIQRVCLLQSAVSLFLLPDNLF